MPAVVSASLNRGQNAVEIELHGNTYRLRNNVLTGWISSHPTGTPTELEAYIVGWLDSSWVVANRGMDVYIHVYTVTPLYIGLLIVGPGTPVDPAWWTLP